MSKSKTGKSQLHTRISKTLTEQGYPKLPEGEARKFAYDFTKEYDLGIGHSASDSLHSTRIEGYASDEPQHLTDETCKKTGKRLNRKQAHDQRLNARKADLYNKRTILPFSSFDSIPEEDEMDAPVLSAAIDTAYYEASMKQAEDGPVFLDRYGLRGELNENTSPIQKVFMQILSGAIHLLGIEGARKILTEVYETESEAKPHKIDGLNRELHQALDKIPHWYKLETLYLESIGFFEFTKDEKAELEALNPNDRKAEEKKRLDKKRKRRAARLQDQPVFINKKLVNSK